MAKKRLQKVGKDDLSMIYNFLVVNSLWPSGSPVQIWRDIHLAAQDSGALFFIIIIIITVLLKLKL